MNWFLRILAYELAVSVGQELGPRLIKLVLPKKPGKKLLPRKRRPRALKSGSR